MPWELRFQHGVSIYEARVRLVSEGRISRMGRAGNVTHNENIIKEMLPCDSWSL